MKLAIRHLLAFALIVVGFGGAIASHGLSVALAEGRHAALLEIEGPIQPTSARFLSRAIDVATNDGAHLLIVVLDTPGGLLSSTRKMVEAMLASDLPIVVYVSPAGAEATSAGTFITAAAHVAAMAPGTNIGAAAPVGSGGEDLPKTLKAKATNVAAAFIRSIAEQRGRNQDALEATVTGPEAYSASKALELNIIDLIVKDLDGLLAAIDGRSVRVENATVVLDTSDIAIQKIERTPLERFLGFLADPNIAFVLMSLGTLGIFVEVMSPGLMVPGIVGAIALALALVALGNLPVNWVGLALLLFALVLFFVEVQVPGFGVFGIAGAISFALGAFFLFGGFSAPDIPTPSFRVNIWLIVGTAAAMSGFVLFVLRDMVAARRLAKTTAAESASSASLLGQVARATTDLNPKGMVHVAGEDWSAMSDSGELIPEGEEVMVLDVEGLTLKVFKESEAGGYHKPTLETDSGTGIETI